MDTNKIKIKNKKSRIYLPIIIGGVILLSGFAYIVLLNGSLFGWRLKSSNISNTPAISAPSTSEQIKNGQDIKKENANSADSNSSKNIPVNPTNPPSSDTPDLGIIISNNSIDTASGVYHIRTIINGAVSNSGICTLTITNSSSSITTLSAATQSQSDYSTCVGFDIQKSNLPNGTYSFKLDVQIGSHKGLSTFTKDISW